VVRASCSAYAFVLVTDTGPDVVGVFAGFATCGARAPSRSETFCTTLIGWAATPFEVSCTAGVFGLFASRMLISNGRH